MISTFICEPGDSYSQTISNVSEASSYILKLNSILQKYEYPATLLLQSFGFIHILSGNAQTQIVRKA